MSEYMYGMLTVKNYDATRRLLRPPTLAHFVLQKKLLYPCSRVYVCFSIGLTFMHI